jgi:type I restriction enzyme S subunit
MLSGWKRCDLGDVLTLQRGFDLPGHTRQEGNIPIVSSSGISGYHHIAKVHCPGVVTGRYGTLGEVFYIKEDYWPLNTTLYVRDFKGNDPLFISFFLRTLNLAQQNTAGAVPGLNRNALHLLPVCIPPLPTQRKIAAILSTYDDLIENNTRRIAILEEMAQSLYREWFVHFHFPGHKKKRMVESALGLIPEGWEVVRFTDIADVLSGGTPRTTTPEFWDGAIPFFTPKDAPATFYVTETEKSITESGLRACNSKLYPKNTIFITARGTVGKVVLSYVDMAMNQSCYALQGRDGIDQFSVFLNIRNCVDQLKQNAHGAVFDTIIVDTFRMLQVVKPPLTLTNAFKSVITPIFDLVLNLLNKNANLRQTRDLLLPKLISGEVDVEGLDIQACSSIL